MTSTHPRPPKERTFIVYGYKPIGRREFSRPLELSADGMFYKFAEQKTITVSDDSTAEMIERQPGAIVEAYEAAGCRNVTVHEVTK